MLVDLEISQYKVSYKNGIVSEYLVCFRPSTKEMIPVYSCKREVFFKHAYLYHSQENYASYFDVLVEL